MFGKQNMKYLSLFSGIGGFELAIQTMFPNAECLGYSEINPSALKVYHTHFPSHTNLGDIQKISETTLTDIRNKGCDLIVAGFPCTNLSRLASISGDSNGLEGKESSLFFDLLRVIQAIQPSHIIIENNQGMKISERNRITTMLEETISKPLFTQMIDASSLGVQTRKRLYWTTFPVNSQFRCLQTWEDVLEPVSDISSYTITEGVLRYNNKKDKGCSNKGRIAVENEDGDGTYKFVETDYSTWWGRGLISDTMSTQLHSPYPIGKSRTIIASAGNNNCVIDRRTGNDSFLIRQFTPLEKERLFTFPDGWTEVLKYKTPRGAVLGRAVVVEVIKHILQQI